MPPTAHSAGQAAFPELLGVVRSASCGYLTCGAVSRGVMFDVGALPACQQVLQRFHVSAGYYLSGSCALCAVTQWDKERVLLRKESGSGMYSLQAWFCSKTLTVAPIQIAQTSVGGLSFERGSALRVLTRDGSLPC